MTSGDQQLLIANCYYSSLTKMESYLSKVQVGSDTVK